MSRMMTNWTNKAIESEIEYTLARGSVTVEHNNFTLLENMFVKWSGDFNRVVKIKAHNIDSLLNTISEIEELFISKGIECPVYLDLDESFVPGKDYSEKLEDRGYSLRKEPFLFSETTNTHLPDDYKLVKMTDEESLSLLKEEQVNNGYYSESEFENTDKKLHIMFIDKFGHYKLVKNDEKIGTVYIALIDDYCRLFSVVINEKVRNCGHGKALIECIKEFGSRSGKSYILLNSPERNFGFYEKCGFNICAYIHRLWRKK
ncbi:MAG TPA: GNAT family N-acetyltransferase [Clostridiales bacterium]|nr:GNAT family N-acetyltransferase [Clostridiales bacterium]HQP70675.1 GNAT family N-acetyltransferase [Clostridiales bacterium]